MKMTVHSKALARAFSFAIIALSASKKLVKQLEKRRRMA